MTSKDRLGAGSEPERTPVSDINLLYDEDVFDEDFNDDDVSTKYILNALADSKESLKKVRIILRLLCKGCFFDLFQIYYRRPASVVQCRIRPPLVTI